MIKQIDIVADNPMGPNASWLEVSLSMKTSLVHMIE